MDSFSAIVIDKFRPSCFFHERSAALHVAVAVSACLAGHKVRYDGADKLLPAYTLLEKELMLIPICPEMSAGLGVPRPPVQLIASENKIHVDKIRALGRENPDLDVTLPLQNFAVQSLQQLTHDHLLCGYLWKSRSPSCGLGSTPLFDLNGREIGRINGIQADHFHRQLPYINHCEENSLQTPNAAAAFILQCRMVFDFLYGSAAPLTALHEHYAFLHKNFDNPIIKILSAAIAANSRKDYLAAFLCGCGQISESLLLKLFKNEAGE